MSAARTPSTAWKETSPPGEAARFDEYARQLRALQKRQAARNARRGEGRTDRALHAKGQLGLEAELVVRGDFAEEEAYVRQGLFGQPAPGTYRAYVRFSNGASMRQSDVKPDVRGVAIKVVGVEGKKIIPGMEDARTQDFLLIRSAATPFRDADEFVPFVLAAERPALLPLRVIAHLGFARGVGLIRALVAGLGAAMTPLAETTYWSALPIQYGPYAVHYQLGPRKTGARAGAKATSRDYLGDDLAARLREGPVTYDLRVQFFVDDAKTPIEDASVEWKESDAPWVTVAALTLPKQDVASARGRRIAEAVEKMSFDPWHALVAHRPLGGMMRARNAAYRESTQERHAAPEPDGTERFE
jgi:hypothetical protein